MIDLTQLRSDILYADTFEALHGVLLEIVEELYRLDREKEDKR